MNQKQARWLWAGVVLIAALGCGMLNDAAEQIGSGMGTVQALATQVDQGGYVETLSALATQGFGGIEATIQAFATDHGDELIATARALATTVSQTDYRATLSVLATEQGPAAQATLQALQTVVAGDPPDDIPVLEGETFEMATTANSLSYATEMDMESVIRYYKTAMPANGWVIVLIGSVEGPQGALLRFEKDGRQATVGITTNPLNNRTLVTVLISLP